MPSLALDRQPFTLPSCPAERTAGRSAVSPASTNMRLIPKAKRTANTSQIWRGPGTANRQERANAKEIFTPISSGRRGVRSSRPPSQGAPNTGAYRQSCVSAARLLESVRSRIQIPGIRDRIPLTRPASPETATRSPMLRCDDPPRLRFGAAHPQSLSGVQAGLSEDVKLLLTLRSRFSGRPLGPVAAAGEPPPPPGQQRDAGPGRTTPPALSPTRALPSRAPATPPETGHPSPDPRRSTAEGQPRPPAGRRSERSSDDRALAAGIVEPLRGVGGAAPRPAGYPNPTLRLSRPRWHPHGGRGR